MDFIREARDLVEVLLRDLLILDESFREGSPMDADALNDAFRQIHTLSGLATLSEAESIRTVSRALESLLDDLRLGRVTLTAAMLETLLLAAEVYSETLTALHRGQPEPRKKIDSILSRIVADGQPNRLFDP